MAWALPALKRKVGRAVVARSIKRRTASHWARVFGLGLFKVVGHTQGREWQERFSVDGKCFSAGSEQAQVWAGAEQCFGEVGAGVDEVFAVVEDQQQGLRPQGIDQRLAQRFLPLFAQAQHHGNFLFDQATLGERGKFDDPDAVLELLDDLGGGLQSQSRFACPAGSGECQQAVVGEQLFGVGDLVFSSDKA